MKEKKFKVLVLDPGGRGHAFVRELFKSSRVRQVFTSIKSAEKESSKTKVFELDGSDPIEQVIQIAQKNRIDFVLFGSEDSLAKGGVDSLFRAGIPAVGPIQEHTWLEGDKARAKDFMQRWHIPIAPYKVFTDYEMALNYILLKKKPLVIKAAYLAAGKGSIVCHDKEEAKKALFDLMIAGICDGAGKEKVVIEDRLFGVEQSVTAFTDGKSVLMAPTARDYKQRFDGNCGPNTGGMGSHSPSGNEDIFSEKKVLERIIYPALRGILKETGKPYKGILYPGLMWVTENGEWNPYVLEFNIRAGDPEAQVILPRLKSPDWATVMWSLIKGTLGKVKAKWSPESFLTVCAVCGKVPPGQTHGKGKFPGYPGKYKRGQIITGLPKNSGNNSYILHARTKLNDKGEYIVDGGRVFWAVGHGPDLNKARNRAYQQLKQVGFPYMDFRTDIGDQDLLTGEKVFWWAQNPAVQGWIESNYR